MMVPYIPVYLAPCGLRQMLVAIVEPFGATAISTSGPRCAVGAGRVARRVKSSSWMREFAGGEKRCG